MIVDASVAVKRVVYEDGSTEALDLLGRELAAPAIWLAKAAGHRRAGDHAERLSAAAGRGGDSRPISQLVLDRKHGTGFSGRINQEASPCSIGCAGCSNERAALMLHKRKPH